MIYPKEHSTKSKVSMQFKFRAYFLKYQSFLFTAIFISTPISISKRNLAILTTVIICNSCNRFDVVLVTGCRIPVFPGTHVVMTSERTVDVVCNVTNQRWTLTCVENSWTGGVGDCTEAVGQYNSAQSEAISKHSGAMMKRFNFNFQFISFRTHVHCYIALFSSPLLFAAAIPVQPKCCYQHFVYLFACYKFIRQYWNHNSKFHHDYFNFNSNLNKLQLYM